MYRIIRDVLVQERGSEDSMAKNFVEKMKSSISQNVLHIENDIQNALSKLSKLEPYFWGLLPMFSQNKN